MHKIDSETLKSQERLINCFKSVFNTSGGKIVLDHLYDHAMSELGNYCSDSNKVHYLEGRRSVLLYILYLTGLDIKKDVILKRYKNIENYEEIDI